MKSLILTFLLTLPLIAFSQTPTASPSPSASPGGRAGARREHSPLENEMSALQRSFRTLGRQYTDPAQKDASAALVASMQKNVEKAKALSPSKAAKLAGDEKTKYTDTYAKDLDFLATELVTLKEAVDAGDNEKTKASLDKIGKLKNTSHKELGIQDEGQRRQRPPGASSPAASPQASPSSSP